MEGVGGGAGAGSGGRPSEPAAAAEERRGPYLEDVAREISSWLFWRDQPETASPGGAGEQERDYQVVTAQPVVVDDARRGGAKPTAGADLSPASVDHAFGFVPVAEGAYHAAQRRQHLRPENGAQLTADRTRIPSPTQELLAESRERLAAVNAVNETLIRDASVASSARADSVCDSRGRVSSATDSNPFIGNRGASSNANGIAVKSGVCRADLAAATQFRNGVAQLSSALEASDRTLPGRDTIIAASGVISPTCDSGVCGDAGSADEASDLEEDSVAHPVGTVDSATMGNKMGTATPEKKERKKDKRSSPFVKVIQESHRRRKMTAGSTSSSAEVLESGASTSPSPVASSAAVAIPVPSGSAGAAAAATSGGGAALAARLSASSAEAGVTSLPSGDAMSQPPAAMGSGAGSIVTDSWKQVRRLQEGGGDDLQSPSDDSSGTFTDPLNSARARPSLSTTSNTATLRQEVAGDADTATLSDAAGTCELPLDETPVYRGDELPPVQPLTADADGGRRRSRGDDGDVADLSLSLADIELSVDDQLSYEADLTRSCDPALLAGSLPRVPAAMPASALLAGSAPAAAAPDKSRSFSQSDVAEAPDAARTPGRTGFTVTKHRKVDLGGRLNQTVPGREWTVSEQCLPGSDGGEGGRRASAGVFVDSNVLRKVASLTHTNTAGSQKVHRPRFLPEKLDFKHYEKFEGQLLVNWFVSSFTEDQSRCAVGEAGLRTMAVQFLTHMLTAGVLRQIEDSSAPLETVFRPDLTYYWARSELPPSQVSTPGRLPSGAWTPFSPAKVEPTSGDDGVAAAITSRRTSHGAAAEVAKDAVQDSVRRIQDKLNDSGSRVPAIGSPADKTASSASPQTTQASTTTQTSPLSPVKPLAKAAPSALAAVKVAPPERSAEAVKLAELEDKLKRLEKQLEKYRTIAGLQELNRGVAKDFSPTDRKPSPGAEVASRMATVATSPVASLSRSAPSPSSDGSSRVTPSSDDVAKSTPTAAAVSPSKASPSRPLPPQPGICAPPPYVPPPPPPPPLPSGGPPPPPPPPPPLPGALPGPPPPPPPPPPLPGMGGPPPPPPLPGVGPPPPPPPPPLPGAGPPPPPPAPGAGPPPPPPIPGGGPPPPPPVPGGPTPLPPPPPGGWNQSVGYTMGAGGLRRVLRKVPVKPKVPMRPLYWTRIQIPVAAATPAPSITPGLEQPQAPGDDARDGAPAGPPRGPAPAPAPPPATPALLWEQLEEEPFEEEEFSDLFARQVVQRKPVKKKEPKSPSKQVKRAKLLESKRSQNVGILISSQHLEIADVEAAVFNFDTSELSLDLLEQIYEMRASDEELKTISSHVQKNPNVPLDKPEQFLYELSQLPHFADRITCLTFQSSFQENLGNIETRLDNLKATCKLLTTSKALQRLFGLILALGNYMNGGNRTRGQADGFGLDIIGKLKDVKSKDNSTTLLHYIVRKYVEKYEPKCVVMPVPGPWDVERCLQIKFDDLASELRKLAKDLRDCQRRTEKVAAASEEAHLQPFKDNMAKFLSEAETSLAAQQKNLHDCEVEFEDLCVFFQCTHRKDNKKMTPKDFFAIWAPFCADFSDIWKREQFRILKESTAKMKQTHKEKVAKKKKEPGGLAARLRSS